MQILVLSGLPGAGKSTHVQQLIADACARGQAAAAVSADDFFIQPDGAWVFDPAKIGDAHAACLQRFIAHCQARDLDVCIVDNTNLSIAEIAPYMAIAQAYGHQAKVVTIKCNAEVQPRGRGATCWACRPMAGSPRRHRSRSSPTRATATAT